MCDCSNDSTAHLSLNHYIHLAILQSLSVTLTSLLAMITTSALNCNQQTSSYFAFKVYTVNQLLILAAKVT